MKSKSKKPGAAKGKSKTRKLTVKKEPIRDLDLSELEARQVKGGRKFGSGIRTED
jgi:hypothetical protein